VKPAKIESKPNTSADETLPFNFLELSLFAQNCVF